jgi:hypothetical protein
MSYLRAYLRNLLILALVMVGLFIFVMIFYPATLSFFSAMGQAYSALKLWPLIILFLLVAALPRRRR